MKTKPILYAAFSCSLSLISLWPSYASAAPADFHLDQVQAAADKGDAESQFLLGRAYSRGEGVPKDNAKALELFQKAANQGNAKAMNNLASMYAHGTGVKQDKAEAAKWYRKGADLGAAFAQNNLGNILAKGDGVPQDCKEAAEWYRKAAEQGLPVAALSLGRLYYFGDKGIEKNYEEAAHWVSKDSDDADAQNILGVLYEEGLGVKKDVKQALVWFQKAADQGNAKAQSNLGRLYSSGSGVDQDPVKAYQWLSLSAQQGEITAQKMFAGFQLGLTPAQVAEGKRLAAEFHAKKRSTGSTTPAVPNANPSPI